MMPMAAEMMVAMPAPQKPMMTESCAPYRQRDSTSRPRLSVPNGNCHDGGFIRLIGLIWLKPCGARKPANRPQNRNNTKTMAQTAPRGFSANKRARSRGGNARRVGREMSVAALMRTHQRATPATPSWRAGRHTGEGVVDGAAGVVSSVPYLRVQEPIAQIHQQIDNL